MCVSISADVAAGAALVAGIPIAGMAGIPGIPGAAAGIAYCTPIWGMVTP